MAPKNQRWWLTADHVELDIEASADALYAMVSDLPRIGAWSPECERVDWEGDVTVPVEGTTFVGHNAVVRGGASATRAMAGCWSPIRAASSPSSPTRAAGSPPCGATGSSPEATAAPG